MISRQLANFSGCVLGLMQAQKSTFRNPEFWSKSPFLLEQQIKFGLNFTLNVKIIPNA